MNPPSPPSRPRQGLAITSLILGSLGFITSLFVVGALFGLLGFIFSIAHVLRRTGRNAMAWVGLALSVFAVAIGVAAASAYYRIYTEVAEHMKQAPSDNSGEFSTWQGVTAPDISVTTLAGQTIKLSELKGKRVVLDFWATWCPPCVKEIPHFIKLRKETSTNELVIVGISSEDAETLKEFVKKQGVNYPIAVAPEDLPAPYKDVQVIPTTFFLDRKGVIQSVLTGYHEFDVLKAHALAADTPAEPKPAPADTPAQP